MPKRAVITRRRSRSSRVFIHDALETATRNALIKKMDEVKVINEVLAAVNSAEQFYGVQQNWPDWLDSLDLDGLCDHLMDRVGIMESEADLMTMLVGPNY